MAGSHADCGSRSIERRRGWRWCASGLLLAAVLDTPSPAWAETPTGATTGAAQTPTEGTTTATPGDDSNTARARQLFTEGVALVREAKWSEALSAFERSNLLRPHAVTTFNVGACERALGRYTRARSVLRAALEQERREPGQLAKSLQQDVVAFLNEIDGLLGVVELTIEPAGSVLSVNGRPLEEQATPNGPEYVAGILPPGPGAVVPRASMRVVLDPGAHVFTIHRKGYADAVVRHSVTPGARTALKLELELLPAILSITANVPESLVRVNGEDLGPVPVEVLRPPGTHDVEVRRLGYETYSANVTAKPGEQLDLSARLVVKVEPLTAKWWFWTGAAVVLVGGAFATYALTRPETPPPPYEGGSTDWVALPGGIEF